MATNKLTIIVLLLIVTVTLLFTGCDEPQNNTNDGTFIGSWEIIMLDDMPHPSHVDTVWSFLENGTIKTTTKTAQVEEIQWWKFTVNESEQRLTQVKLPDQTYEEQYTYEFKEGGKQVTLTRHSTPQLLLTLERIEV